MMKDQTTYKDASTDLTAQRRNEILSRCFKMVDYLNDTVGDIILDFVDNNECSKARQLLLKSPETIAIKAFEKAISDLKETSRRHDASMH
jgi:hypothetical protein